ncbi:MAG: hypothetical protein JXR76_10150 [Deltaproteobacteria bacterium]|nr:hypothetical protein [Deltaproteobacteria bacterium]
MKIRLIALLIALASTIGCGEKKVVEQYNSIDINRSEKEKDKTTRVQMSQKPKAENIGELDKAVPTTLSCPLDIYPGKRFGPFVFGMTIDEIRRIRRATQMDTGGASMTEFVQVIDHSPEVGRLFVVEGEYKIVMNADLKLESVSVKLNPEKNGCIRFAEKPLPVDSFAELLKLFNDCQKELRIGATIFQCEQGRISLKQGEDAITLYITDGTQN